MPEQGIGEAHWPARVYRDTVGPDRWGRIFTFSFWRHPLSLVLSTFHYRRDRLGEENPHKLPSGAEFRPWVMDWLRHHPVDPGEGHAELSANHTYWTDEDGSPLIDRLYSFHDLDAAWADITREVGIDVALPEYNSTGRRRVEDFYDDETRRVVLDRFREDEPILQRFGLSLGCLLYTSDAADD